MKNSTARVVLTVLIMAFSFPVLSQKERTVEGNCVYYAESDVSIDDAKRTALERAMNDALANEFGTLVTQNNSTLVRNAGESQGVDFFSISSSSVMGEWIETIGEPEYMLDFVDDILVVKCRVKGYAREIVTGGVDLQAKVLRNGTDAKFEDEDFRAGDDIYLSFRSPIDGFLAVYLVNEDGQAYCLLPYQGQKEGIYEVEGGKEYIFFSSKDASPAQRQVVDEYVVKTELGAESNFIYILFSPNRFTKAVDCHREGTPRQLGFEDFDKWLAKNRRHDRNLQQCIRRITITK